MQGKGRTSFILFLLGLGNATKVYFLGVISFSELAIFFLAPFLLLKNWNRMKREGFLTFIYMLFFLMLGLFVSSCWNHSPWPFVVKLFAVFYGMLAFYVVFYILLHDNFKGIGWFFLGSFISGIITIWAFNPTADVSSTGFVYIGNAEAEEVIRGPLFWIGKVRGLGQLPIVAAYLKTPIVYSIISPILFVAFAMFNTITGRAQSICVLASSVMMFIGRKSRRSMQNIGKHFGIAILMGIVIILAYKTVYSYAAGNGHLGEDARNKYESQTERGKGVFSMLVSGRTEFFIALSAIVDRPIFGFGPRAVDTNRYMERFLLKYGTAQDIQGYFIAIQRLNAFGLDRTIPTHSHIMAAWLWCGLPGLIFFLWVLYVIFRHVRHYASVVPQWYGYFAIAIPSVVWSIFFNPFGARSTLPLLMVLMFFAKSIGDRKMLLPFELEIEAQKYD
jgi:hypothetical protein